MGRNLVSVTTDKGDIKELPAIMKELKARTVIIWFRIVALGKASILAWNAAKLSA